MTTKLRPLALAVVWMVAGCADGDSAQPQDAGATAGQGARAGAGGGGASGAGAAALDGAVGARGDGGMASDAAAGRDAATEVSADAGADAAVELAGPNEDRDGDGLTTAEELSVGTDPRAHDTDVDGLGDGLEVGAMLDSPRDGDADGIPDALEHPRFDNDGDGIVDTEDAVAGPQLVAMRFAPSVIANDGVDATRLSVQLTAADGVAKVEMGTQGLLPVLLPDELEVDGVALRDGFLELFDDGTHGDLRAGDGIYNRGGLRTTMAIRGGDPGVGPGPRCRLIFNELRITDASGTTTRRLGDNAENLPPLTPSLGALLIVIDSSIVAAPTSIAADAQHTSHALNIVDPAGDTLVTRVLESGDGDAEDSAVHALAARVLDVLERDLDFIYFTGARPSYGSLAGRELGMGNQVQGLGLAVRPPPRATGSEGRLQAMLFFRFGTDAPLAHETMHRWAVHLAPSLVEPLWDAHWGVAGSRGVLGGFDPATLVDHGDGSYTVDRFQVAGGDWTTTVFSPIELYLAGLLPAQELTPIPVLWDAEVTGGTDATVTFTATRTELGVAEISAVHGPRLPAAGDAQTQFDGAFVVLSDALLSASELALIEDRAAGFSDDPTGAAMSFDKATGGRAQLDVRIDR